jgi:hypothetical protein
VAAEICNYSRRAQLHEVTSSLDGEIRIPKFQAISMFENRRGNCSVLGWADTQLNSASTFFKITCTTSLAQMLSTDGKKLHSFTAIGEEC